MIIVGAPCPSLVPEEAAGARGPSGFEDFGGKLPGSSPGDL